MMLKKSYVNAGMPCKKLSGIGLFIVCILLQYGIDIPDSGESGTAGHGLVRQCQVMGGGGGEVQTQIR
jgi:hypothetical protein